MSGLLHRLLKTAWTAFLVTGTLAGLYAQQARYEIVTVPESTFKVKTVARSGRNTGYTTLYLRMPAYSPEAERRLVRAYQLAVAANTRVATTKGSRAANYLNKGDLVYCREKGGQVSILEVGLVHTAK